MSLCSSLKGAVCLAECTSAPSLQPPAVQCAAGRALGTSASLWNRARGGVAVCEQLALLLLPLFFLHLGLLCFCSSHPFSLLAPSVLRRIYISVWMLALQGILIPLAKCTAPVQTRGK